MKKMKLNDIWYNVTYRYDMYIKTGRKVFLDEAKHYYRLYTKLGGKRKFPTKYNG